MLQEVEKEVEPKVQDGQEMMVHEDQGQAHKVEEEEIEK